MKKQGIAYKDLIAGVQAELVDAHGRVSDRPTPFRWTWWLESPDFQDMILSDHGVPSDDQMEQKELEAAFSEEVKTIQKVLMEKGFPAEKGSMDSAFNLMAEALNVWDQICLPVRRTNEFVVRIHAPRDILGSPIFQRMALDDYVRGASAKTARDAAEIAAYQKRLRQWKGAAITAFVVLRGAPPLTLMT